jgi:hypothetical protein
MGEHSQKAFTTDKLKKFEVSGKNGGSGNGDKGASADDYGRKAARTSDSSAFAAGGAAKAPSLGRAGRANGGRTRDISKLTDSGPKGYGDRPLIRAKGGRIGRQLGGALPPGAAGTPPGLTTPPPAGQLPGLPGLGRKKGGRVGRDAGGPVERTRGYSAPDDKWDDTTKQWADDQMSAAHDFDAGQRAKGGRVGRAHGGKAKGAKGKTVVNVIVGGDKGQQPPPTPPIMPHPMVPPPPPPPPQQGMPPMPPPGGMPPGAGMPPPPPRPPMPPPGGMPPGMPPPGMGRAHGGRISEKFGAGSGRGRMEKTKRQGHGKVKLAE